MEMNRKTEASPEAPEVLASADTAQDLEKNKLSENNGEERPPFDGKNPPPFDGKNPPPFDGKNPPPFDGKRPPFDGKNPPPFDGKRPPFDGKRPPFDGKRPPFDGKNGNPPPRPAHQNLFDKAALDATKVTYITPKNAKFKDNDGFLTMEFEGKPETRVNLHLLFPYDSEEENVSVLDSERREIGIITDIKLFEGDDLFAIKREIARKYYIREIVKVNALKDGRGVSHWTVTCKDAPNEPAEFSLRDTYSAIFRVTPTHLVITDNVGNRFEIKDVTKLDRKSYRKIEIYI